MNSPSQSAQGQRANVPAPQVSAVALVSVNKPQKDLNLRALPPVEKIRKAVPAKGIGIQRLVSKFPSIDESNARLFAILVAVLCCVTPELQVFPRPEAEIPSKSQINDIFKEARKPPPPKPILEPEGKHKFSSEWINSPKVTFSEPEELIRQASKILPRNWYRIFYETSATLCSYVNKETHTEYRETPASKLQLKLLDGNAFQSLGKPAINDVTKQRLERHLIWNQKHPPSSYISAFNELKPAIRRAEFHYNESQRIGHRLSCARISTKGVVAATIRGRILETTTIFKKVELEWEVKSSEGVERDVQVPVWVRRLANGDDHSAMSLQDLIDSDTEIWLSTAELRVSDLKVSASRNHDYEWLALGRISEANIANVMPFDGNTLHMSKPDRTVYSLRSKEPFVFEYETWKWRYDPEKARLARSEHHYIPQESSTVGNPRAGLKHGHSQAKDTDKNGDDEHSAKHTKITPMSWEGPWKETKVLSSATDEEPPATAAEDLENNSVDIPVRCCPTCQQKWPRLSDTPES